jgi:hypothetical protein
VQRRLLTHSTLPGLVLVAGEVSSLAQIVGAWGQNSVVTMLQQRLKRPVEGQPRETLQCQQLPRNHVDEIFLSEEFGAPEELASRS